MPIQKNKTTSRKKPADTFPDDLGNEDIDKFIDSMSEKFSDQELEQMLDRMIDETPIY